jgi:hypothetical protein
MSDDEPKDTADTYPPDYLDRLPPPPPIRPDWNLIGDLQWPEKIDRKRKRRWFGLRSWTPTP